MYELTKTREEKIKELWQESKEKAAQRLAQSKNLTYINLRRTPIDPKALELIPEKEAKKACLAAFQRTGNRLAVAVLNPENFAVIFILENLKKQNIKPVVYIATKESLEWAWQSYEFIKPKAAPLLSGFIDLTNEENIIFSEINQQLKQISLDNTTKLTAIILKSAIRADASDIHFEPQEKKALIRFRIDGVLYDTAEIEKEKYQKIRDRLKFISGLKLNITETAQNGRFVAKDDNLFFDVRASTLPGAEGEFLVFRLLNPLRIAFGLEDLGLNEKGIKTFVDFLSSPNGMIIVTGPTGSGKTTTLYTLLKKKISPGIKIITIEDPIEYKLEGISQTQVSKNYDFATGLKAILRQDPEVILVGEMRDQETVKTAISASLTGHLVFSTLHTNEASGAISRLLELGTNQELIANALKLVIAQRLARRLCPYCKEKYQPETEFKKNLLKTFTILSPKAEVAIPKNINYLWRAKGCAECRFLGYQKQIGIFEYFPLSIRMAELINQTTSQEKIRLLAIEEGMVPLFHDALLKAIAGITSWEEVKRVTGDIDYIQKFYQSAA